MTKRKKWRGDDINICTAWPFSRTAKQNMMKPLHVGINGNLVLCLGKIIHSNFLHGLAALWQLAYRDSVTGHYAAKQECMVVNSHQTYESSHWQDTVVTMTSMSDKAILLLGTSAGTLFTSKVEWQNKWSREKLSLHFPSIIMTYKFRDGVGLMDSLRSLYQTTK
jgi:hypothetical protein